MKQPATPNIHQELPSEDRQNYRFTESIRELKKGIIESHCIRNEKEV